MAKSIGGCLKGGEGWVPKIGKGEERANKDTKDGQGGGEVIGQPRSQKKWRVGWGPEVRECREGERVERRENRDPVFGEVTGDPIKRRGGEVGVGVNNGVRETLRGV